LPSAAICPQAWLSFEPTTGRFATQTGGGGKEYVAAPLIHPTIWSAWLTIVPTEREKGMIKTSSRARVIMTTAGERLPPNHRWKRSMTGQVATTIMVAQIIARRKGRMIQNTAVSRTPMKRMPRVIPVMSRERPVLHIRCAPF
jgi:hypothetical protein